MDLFFLIWTLAMGLNQIYFWAAAVSGRPSRAGVARSQELRAYFAEFEAIFFTMARTSFRSLSFRLVA